MSILFICKEDDYYVEKAKEFIKINFENVTIIEGQRGQLLPSEAKSWTGEYIISYLAPWVIPKEILQKAKKAAINFHPGPPEYPGIGCTNFAIYNEEKIFGVTCHHMNPKVDSGDIIAVRRFPLLETDTVYSLTQRCYSYILTLFYEIVNDIIQGDKLPKSQEKWTREPYKRYELNALCKITQDMTDDEIKRRIRAVKFPGAPGAYIEINGMKFEYSED